MTDKFTIFNMGLNGSFIKENGKIMEIERVVDLLNKGDHLKQPHKEILRDLEVTTFDKELLQKEKEGLYKENKQLKMHMKSVKAHLEGGKEDMTEKRCKYCKSIRVTIVPPSKEQYCTKKGKYVKLTDCCVDFFYDETAPQRYKDYGDIE